VLRLGQTGESATPPHGGGKGVTEWNRVITNTQF